MAPAPAAPPWSGRSWRAWRSSRCSRPCRAAGRRSPRPIRRAPSPLPTAPRAPPASHSPPCDPRPRACGAGLSVSAIGNLLTRVSGVVGMGHGAERAALKRGPPAPSGSSTGVAASRPCAVSARHCPAGSSPETRPWHCPTTIRHWPRRRRRSGSPVSAPGSSPRWRAAGRHSSAMSPAPAGHAARESTSRCAAAGFPRRTCDSRAAPPPRHRPSRHHRANPGAIPHRRRAAARAGESRWCGWRRHRGPAAPLPAAPPRRGCRCRSDWHS
jgi:hypothetical protein